MFANQRRGTAGLGSIGAVAAVLVAWFVTTGVMMKTYREGGLLSMVPEGSTCQLVCQTGAPRGNGS